MDRRAKAVLLLMASPVLYTGGRVSMPNGQPGILVFFTILIGIISYGYLVMADEELDEPRIAKPMLTAFSFACAGTTTITKVFVDACIAHSLPAASIAAAGLWAAVTIYVIVRTPLFKAYE